MNKSVWEHGWICTNFSKEGSLLVTIKACYLATPYVLCTNTQTTLH